MNSIADFLINDYGWYEGTAKAMERADGICEYCREDLLSSRAGYSSICIDHLLPRAKYQSEEINLDNYALSCSSCNTMKQAYDPLLKGEDAKKMLSEKRNDLIQRVQTHLKPKIEKRMQEWQHIHDEIRS